MLVTSSVALIFPNYIKNVRTSLFVDGGNVFDSNESGSDLGINGFQANKLRYSTGLEINWISPLGIMLQFSFSKAFNTQGKSNTKFFGFNITGASNLG